MIIWVDCDEVLSETVSEIIKRPPYDRFNLNIEDITSYYLGDLNLPWISKTEEADVFFNFFESEEYRNTKSVKWAFEALSKLKAMWHTLVVVTARPDKYRNQTVQRVEKHYPNIFSDFLFKNQYMENEVPKSQLCLQKWIQFLIDDNTENILDVNEEWIPWVLLDKPWNQWVEDDEMIIRAYSWDEIDAEMLLSFL